MMAGIRGRDTKIEVAVRKALFARGFRYRIDVRGLPGRPDIVLPKYRAAIFAHGCFWHLHGCRLTKIPATRKEFWNEKLQGNRRRDERNVSELLDAGWRVALVWECSLRGRGDDGLMAVTDGLTSWLLSGERQAEFVG